MGKTRLSVALEATQIALWDWDIKRDRWHASPVYFTQLGYAPERHPECKVWLERVHPQDRPRVRGAFDSALSEPTARHSTWLA
jgi:PAS domain-containing protein